MNRLGTKVICAALLVGAFLIAVLQPLGVTPDYTNYEYFFQKMRGEFAGEGNVRFEPGFVYASTLLATAFSSDLIVYGIFVVIAMLIKLIAIEWTFVGTGQRRQYYFYLAIIFYVCKFFPLHELTQLRASLAISFVMIGACMVWNGQRWRGALAAVAAGLFHYSSLMVAPFYFLPRMSRRMALLLPLGLMLLLQFLSPLAIGVAQIYFVVFDTYEFGDPADALNPLSPVLLPEFFLLVVAFVYWRHLNDGMRRIVVLEMVGFAIFYGLFDFGVIAVRAREFFSVLWTLFLVQAGDLPQRMRLLVNAFVAMMLLLSFYQYFILNFFDH